MDNLNDKDSNEAQSQPSILGDVIGSSSCVEEMIFKLKFKNEKYEPNDFNDWAKENESEAYNLCLKIARFLTRKKN